MLSFKNVQTRDELAFILRMPIQKLTHLLYIKKPENSYIQFKIPKRSGGVRQICAPDDDLKAVQKLLAKKLLSHRNEYWKERGITPNISHAFEPKKGIITNAYIHRNKRFVLNIDLKDFFDSIHFGRVQGYFQKNENWKFSYEAATVIAQLCCYQGKLPQGAPTSPIISNLICEILDFRLLQIAKRHMADYTRYADDLTFSSNDKNFLIKFKKFYDSINQQIVSSGFSINEKKTRLQYRDSRQSVTGLTVNAKISVDHNYYKQTRAMAMSLYRNREFYINGELGSIEQLEGRFAFINQLDKYNNKLKPLSESSCKDRDYNGRERQYQQFLFYRYFFAHNKPIIVTEGKTDIVYLKAALMNRYKEYPALVQRCPDGTFEFKVAFLKKTKRLRYFFNLSIGGADTLGNIFELYVGNKRKQGYYQQFVKLCSHEQANPVILMFDNELNIGGSPIKKFINKFRLGEEFEQKLSEQYYGKTQSEGKFYITTHKLVGDAKKCEIEDLFDEATRSHKINGKSLSLSDSYDKEKYYGKNTFSKFVYANFEKINFDNFGPTLDALAKVIEESTA